VDLTPIQAGVAAVQCMRGHVRRGTRRDKARGQIFWRGST
jgi:hypothetical protein